jgi:hypothetical protein
MPSKFSYNPWEVSDLVTGVDKGTIRLPDIQRPFVWSNSKVRDLIDSMYRGYPVGELMFWKNAGIIPAGTALTAADADISVDAEVLDDGYIKVGDHTYEDLDRAAHAAGADASSGWTFWEVQVADESGLRPLADIRSQVNRSASLAAVATET